VKIVDIRRRRRVP